MLTPEEQKWVDYLCRRIADERDFGKVTELMRELNELLAAKYPPTASPAE